MLLSTNLLETYGDLGWIRHPGVSSVLDVASLQREGKNVAEAVGKNKTEKGLISQNTKDIKAVGDKLDRLCQKNPGWNT